MKQRLPHPFLAVLVLLIASTAISIPATAADATPASGEAATETPASQIVAYYFHGNLRCATCRKLEAYSEEAMTQGFPGELASGRIDWRVVNTDQAENTHFVHDFELVTKSLVLVEYRDGDVVRWQNLKLIWQLVKDRDGFLNYVRNATREFIEEG